MRTLRLAVSIGISTALALSGCGQSDDESSRAVSDAGADLSPFLVDPADPNADEYDIVVPQGVVPVIGVFSLATDAFVDEIAAANASADNPVEEEFDGCDPVAAWLQPEGDGYRFVWQQGFTDCATAVPYVAIYELP